MVGLLGVLVSAALAGPTPASDIPDVLPRYDDEVLAAAWTALDQAINGACRWPGGDPGSGRPPLSCDEDALATALHRANQLIDHLGEDARILHLRALAHRFAGDPDQALADLRRAARLDPARADVQADLGELLAAQGDREGARKAFEAVTRLVPDGRTAWYGWFQLAQLDAREGNATALMDHLRQAVRFGFRFEWMAGNPLWVEAAKDPDLRDVLERMIRVYGDPDILSTLIPEAQPPSTLPEPP